MRTMVDPKFQVRPLTPEEEKARRKRSIAIALTLGALVILFFVLTIAKLGPQILERPL
jgi:hypothetical protein